jgi:hypothetical protein
MTSVLIGKRVKAEAQLGRASEAPFSSAVKHENKKNRFAAVIGRRNMDAVDPVQSAVQKRVFGRRPLPPCGDKAGTGCNGEQGANEHQPQLSECHDFKS